MGHNCIRLVAAPHRGVGVEVVLRIVRVVRVARAVARAVDKRLHRNVRGGKEQSVLHAPGAAEHRLIHRPRVAHVRARAAQGVERYKWNLKAKERYTRKTRSSPGG
jgi:hypothetical protein